MFILQVLNKLTCQLWQDAGEGATRAWAAWCMLCLAHTLCTHFPFPESTPGRLTMFIAVQMYSMGLIPFPTGNRGPCAKENQCETCCFPGETLTEDLKKDLLLLQFI